MYNDKPHSTLERLAIAVAVVALTLATFGAFVFVPSDAAERNAIVQNAAPSHALVDVKFVSYEPATRIN